MAQSNLVFKIIAIAVAFVETCILWDSNRYGISLALSAIVIWLLKDILNEWNTMSSYHEENSRNYYYTYNDYDYGYPKTDDYSRWMPKSYTYSKEKEISKLANMLLKPNTNIVFEDDAKTKEVNERKEAFIKKPIDFTKFIGVETNKTQVTETKHNNIVALLPAPTVNETPKNGEISTEVFDSIANIQTSACDNLLIENVSTVTEKRKIVYDTIIRQLSIFKLNVGYIKTFLESIPYIDVFEQGQTVTIFCKRMDLFQKFQINDKQIIEAVQIALGDDWHVSYAEFLPLSIADYYLKI